MSDKLTIEQRHRDAAANAFQCFGYSLPPEHAQRQEDQKSLAEAFARFEASLRITMAGDYVMVPKNRLESVYHVIHAIHDTCEDEGDRMYLGSTNDQHTLKRQLRVIEKMLSAASPTGGE